MTVINTNTAALRAQNGTRTSNMALQTAMARLSSGKRINTAADDAAGLAISNSMTSQITGMNQAVRNANDGISLLQTADGALDEVTNMAQRIRELAVQAGSGTYSETDRTNMQAEVTQLTTQMKSILTGTTFNGVGLFDTTAYNASAAAGAAGNGKTYAIQTGAGSSDQTSIVVGNLDVTNINNTAGATPSAMKGFLVQESVTTSGSESNDGAANAQQTLTNVDNFLKSIATVRAGIGAGESRLNSVVNNLTNNATNLTDARSRIQDADFSAETTNLAKAQILSQASTAMLAQANQSQQGVLKLLQ